MGLSLYCAIGYIITKVGVPIYLYSTSYYIVVCIYSWLLLNVPYWDAVSSVGYQVLLGSRDSMLIYCSR